MVLAWNDGSTSVEFVDNLLDWLYQPISPPSPSRVWRVLEEVDDGSLLSFRGLSLLRFDFVVTDFQIVVPGDGVVKGSRAFPNHLVFCEDDGDWLFTLEFLVPISEFMPVADIRFPVRLWRSSQTLSFSRPLGSATYRE